MAKLASARGTVNKVVILRKRWNFKGSPRDSLSSALVYPIHKLKREKKKDVLPERKKDKEERIALKINHFWIWKEIHEASMHLQQSCSVTLQLRKAQGCPANLTSTSHKYFESTYFQSFHQSLGESNSVWHLGTCRGGWMICCWWDAYKHPAAKAGDTACSVTSALRGEKMLLATGAAWLKLTHPVHWSRC